MNHLEPCREIEKELTVDTEYLDMMGRDMMCAYQPGIHGPKNEKSNRGIFSVLGSLLSASRYDVSDWWWISC